MAWNISSEPLLKSYEESKDLFVPWSSIEKSDEFQKLSKKDKIARFERWVDDSDNALKGLFGYKPQATHDLVDFARPIYKRLQQLPDDPEPKPIEKVFSSFLNLGKKFNKKLNMAKDTLITTGIITSIIIAFYVPLIVVCKKRGIDISPNFDKSQLISRKNFIIICIMYLIFLPLYLFRWKEIKNNGRLFRRNIFTQKLEYFDAYDLEWKSKR